MSEAFSRSERVSCSHRHFFAYGFEVDVGWREERWRRPLYLLVVGLQLVVERDAARPSRRPAQSFISRHRANIVRLPPHQCPTLRE
jgi:hypothetical protein